MGLIGEILYTFYYVQFFNYLPNLQIIRATHLKKRNPDEEAYTISEDQK